jgi:hypothetical protein
MGFHIPLEPSPLLARLNVSKSVVSRSIGKRGSTVDIAASASAGRLAFADRPQIYASLARASLLVR